MFQSVHFGKGGVGKPKWGVQVNQITPNHNLVH